MKPTSGNLFIPKTFVNVILPLAIPQIYTYAVPDEWAAEVQEGVRVEVQFGKNRLYAALVQTVHQQPPNYSTKSILSVLDNAPIINEKQLRFWHWIAQYYCCTIGEVMNAALPSGLRLGSETKVVLSEHFKEDYSALTDDEYLIAEALAVQNELSIDDLQQIIGRKSVHSLIQALLKKEVILLKEELLPKYKPKIVQLVRFTAVYRQDFDTITGVLDKLPKNAEKQMELILALVQLSRTEEEVTKTALLEMSKATAAVIQALEKKNIIEVYEKEITRTKQYGLDVVDAGELSEGQRKAILDLKTEFQDKNVVLLHGVTGSGKTRVYTELMQEMLARGKQVLYLLPEIALTTQLIYRLQKTFGNDIAVYHSKLNHNERVDMWKDTLAGKGIILSARSGLFLPFKNLGLVIVDEEHDPSYKQQDPAPRYNARDTSIYLASLFGGKVLLGTATPSLESFYNTKGNKYGLVTMNERFGGVQLPQMVVVDIKTEAKEKRMKGSFSDYLLKELKEAIERGEQAILFQNRRGYAPVHQCQICAWTMDCISCDVSLTYHKYGNVMRCHYCGYHTTPPKECPACGSHLVSHKGFGTEKIEEELQDLLPDARIARMDLDTVKTKHAHSRLIQEIEDGQIDILIGTQMVTKGLDFEKVRVVGILSADSLLHFPDFRAGERAFQLMMQVAGRAGRREEQGKVIVQASHIAHPVLQEILSNDFEAHFQRECMERYKFNYPPFYRLVRISIKHKDLGIVHQVADVYASELRKVLDKSVLGPTEPGVSRIRSYYILDILLKLDRQTTHLAEVKQLLHTISGMIWAGKGWSTVQIAIDVDPY